MMPRFTSRFLLAVTLFLAGAAAIAAAGNVGALAMASLGAALPVVAVVYAAIKHEPASWAIWLFWPILAAGIFWLAALWLERFGGT